MSKPAGSSRTSAPMIRLSRMLPTWVLSGSVQSGTQFSCTSTHCRPEVRGHRGDLAGVVGLVAADRHQGVRALGQRLGDEVLQLAGLVAAVGEAGVAVLALGPHLGAAEVGAEPGQRMDRAGPEGQLVAREVLEGHVRSIAVRLGSRPSCRATAVAARMVSAMQDAFVIGTRMLLASTNVASGWLSRSM